MRLNYQSLTCESLSPSFSANFLRSGFEMYFWIWNRFSSPCRCASEKTALLIIPLLGFPRAAAAHGKDAAKWRPSGWPWGWCGCWWWLPWEDRPFDKPLLQLMTFANCEALLIFDPIISEYNVLSLLALLTDFYSYFNYFVYKSIWIECNQQTRG